ncbi:MAG: beta-ketoacyl synthase N-terminal-like domain-containing protein, partial [Chloroflexota bacterium]
MRKPDYTRRIGVTGVGLVSPIGTDVDTAWSNLVNGVSGLKRITYWDPEPYDCRVAGEVHDFDPNEWMSF